MRTIRYKSRGNDVFLLEEILDKLGYELKFINSYFDLQTQQAVIDFQKKNNLVADGIVGQKTWTLLLKNDHSVFDLTEKYLSEQDMIAFADEYGLELATVKAVNEVESKGRGFLIDGRPKILFEGHIFWKELKKRGVDPSEYVNDFTKNVLYAKWTKVHYVGGRREYSRIDKASGMSDDKAFRESALSSASWGCFQIMGFHAKNLGYPSVEHFVSEMYGHERDHLKAFGLFLDKNNLIKHLKNKDWAKFAKGYNGASYKKNKYDVKLEQAYLRYKDM